MHVLFLALALCSVTYAPTTPEMHFVGDHFKVGTDEFWVAIPAGGIGRRRVELYTGGTVYKDEQSPRLTFSSPTSRILVSSDGTSTDELGHFIVSRLGFSRLGCQEITARYIDPDLREHTLTFTLDLKLYPME
jgi:hypothetical protein